ncbi:MAG: tripartite tricarboxylate transporter substrate binding protein [Lautropia sp.]
MYMPISWRRQLRSIASLIAAVGSLLALPPLAAASYPTHTVRIIVPFAPGGGADMIARVVAERLNAEWKQPVIVENRTGAGGTIGTDMAARSGADGYTLLLASPDLPVNATLYRSRNLSIDPTRDFDAVALAAVGPLVLVVNRDAPYKDLKDVIAAAKQQPGRVLYGSAGVGTSPHMAGELFRSFAGVDITHIPYKGTGPGLLDLIGGQVHLFFAPLPTVVSHLQSGKLRALGVTTAARHAALPDVPTVAESGIAGFEVLQWWGFVAPRGVSKAIIDEQNRQIVRAMNSPELKARLAAIGAESSSESAASFGALLHRETGKWRKVIEDGKIVAE